MISNEIIFGKVVYMDARRVREDEWVTTNEIDCSIKREREIYGFLYILRIHFFNFKLPKANFF